MPKLTAFTLQTLKTEAPTSYNFAVTQPLTLSLGWTLIIRGNPLGSPYTWRGTDINYISQTGPLYIYRCRISPAPGQVALKFAIGQPVPLDIIDVTLSNSSPGSATTLTDIVIIEPGFLQASDREPG